MYFPRKHLALLLTVVLMFLSSLRGIAGDLPQCRQCNERDCQTDLVCPGQMILDPCGCCIECAKELGETCGELDGEYYGQCRQGLICAKNWGTDIILNPPQTKQPSVCIKGNCIKDFCIFFQLMSCTHQLQLKVKFNF